MLLKFVPKAEFLSARRAPVTNRRSRTPTCGAAHREEAPRPEREVQTASKALDALPRPDQLGLLRRQKAVPTVRAVSTAEQPAREYAEAVVVVLRQRQIARDVRRGDRNIHQTADLVPQIGTDAGLPEVVRLEDALLPL